MPLIFLRHDFRHLFRCYAFHFSRRFLHFRRCAAIFEIFFAAADAAFAILLSPLFRFDCHYAPRLLFRHAATMLLFSLMLLLIAAYFDADIADAAAAFAAARYAAFSLRHFRLIRHATIYFSMLIFAMIFFFSPA